ncbi:MAG: integron integrase [Thermodesulfobacteriota bacterium]
MIAGDRQFSNMPITHAFTAMLPIPSDILASFDEILKQREIPASLHIHYRKWLRYFLDFCDKYPPPETRSEQVKQFIAKLHSKKQTPELCKQAAHAASLYFEVRQSRSGEKLSGIQPATPPTRPASRPPEEPETKALLRAQDNLSTSKQANPARPAARQVLRPSPVRSNGGKRFNEWRCLEKTKSPVWDQAINKLAAEIEVRHYSRKTLKTYADWVRKFQHYLRDKPVDDLSSGDVKEYLTHLAVNCRVASSTQNQAFNALLFLFRHVLKKDFGDQRDVPRAKKSRYIPVVLSRAEIDSVIMHLDYPFDIVVKLLYGCGLRLFECVKLRVQNFNFDDGILTVHGKGDKDRTVPIPQTIMPELKKQIDVVSKLHDRDLATGYSGVFLDHALEKKYPGAAKEFIWQWFFPQKGLTSIPGTKEHRRYHLHESRVQEAIKAAARQAKLTKRVKSHTFRHSFATHLLQANYDIRTIQTLLGHSDVRTTMIYTHCVPSRTVKEARSPLDF